MINWTKGGNGYKQETKILDYGTAAEFFCIFTLGDKAGFSGRIRVPRWQQIYRERKLESFISCQLFLAFGQKYWPFCLIMTSLKLRKICFHHYKCKYCICLSALAFRWNGAAPASPWIAVQEKSLKGMVFCQTPTSKNISACVRVTN